MVRYIYYRNQWNHSLAYSVVQLGEQNELFRSFSLSVIRNRFKNCLMMDLTQPQFIFDFLGLTFWSIWMMTLSTIYIYIHTMESGFVIWRTSSKSHIVWCMWDGGRSRAWLLLEWLKSLRNLVKARYRQAFIGFSVITIIVDYACYIVVHYL